ncbi:MAG: Spy/CpxP family protein refolding chaperone [Gloeomargarita sp. SKYBB_i_bin120]|nr:Spy/CpxP family protein refolding chaperone [Gloeomargarita sp. SKYG98]MCS7292002.1 Spy/CpxP family protein refolding chaperone [Gloeomargarita sp. SKYB120]MDW8177562.1 Spy/CpxP family protein refolding chaperone [Gloeomargarita sp. SKYBB_i_bin120]
MRFFVVLPVLLGVLSAMPVLAVEFTGVSELAQASKRRGFWSELQLTPEQLQRIQQIRANARQQMQQVLTPAQRQQLRQAQTPAERRQILRRLQLTEAQKAQIRQIRANTRQQIEAILTPEQRQRLEARRQQQRRVPKPM